MKYEKVFKLLLVICNLWFVSCDLLEGGWFSHSVICITKWKYVIQNEIWIKSLQTIIGKLQFAICNLQSAGRGVFNMYYKMKICNIKWNNMNQSFQTIIVKLQFVICKMLFAGRWLDFPLTLTNITK